MITDVQQRRRRDWTTQQKIALVHKAVEANNCYRTAKENQIALSQLFRWKKELMHLLPSSAACSDKAI